VAPIAERTGLSERRCAHMRSSPSLERVDLVREIEDAIAFYDEAISELAITSATAPAIPRALEIFFWASSMGTAGLEPAISRV
jgi:hypothetical protein